MSNFKIGDTVILNSGGPEMTIEMILGEENNNIILESQGETRGFKKGDLYCIWFDNKNKKSDFFNKDTVYSSEEREKKILEMYDNLNK